jgi:mannose-6-phosphate isomerase-like protein (cupin superfamily)
MPTPISKKTAPHYIWGRSCDGWRLVNTADLSVIEEKVPAKASEQRHYHERAYQFFYILSGNATIELEGKEIQLTPGSGIEITPGLHHKFMNKSSDDVYFLVISTPSTQGDRVNVEEE